jgi:hypothetical protein
MSEHLGFDYTCPCGDKFLPLEEEGKKCPKCGMVANVKSPSVAEVVKAAKANIGWPGPLAVMDVSDRYMITALKIIVGIRESEKPPRNEVELEVKARRIVSGMDFSSGEYNRKHANTFVKAVIREAFLKGDGS